MIRGMAKEIGVPIGWLSGCVAADERRGGEWEQRPAAVDPPRGIAAGDWTHPAGWPRETLLQWPREGREALT